ncbi:hypothetical protein [Pseudooceanicola nitratireducens]|uniref:hypothetical protein n=2 Tax=Pseudooceanicola nitratireducens TaxID=517719 RepID=UPI002EA30FB0|nr:hypothetical protein [Pseudomonadota bacterium]
MWYLRHLTLGLLLALPGATHAAPADLGDPVMIFAGCAGRFSAEMEHSWLIGRDETAVRGKRLAMIDLVDAALPPGRGPEVLARRIEAKFAQAMLLQRASFSRDAGTASRAQARARAALRQCEALLPG